MSAFDRCEACAGFISPDFCSCAKDLLDEAKTWLEILVPTGKLPQPYSPAAQRYAEFLERLAAVVERAE